MSCFIVGWPTRGLTAVLTLIGLSATSFAGESPILINENVAAATGGTFTDNPLDPQITITIPPGALSDDSRLQVRLAGNITQVGPNQTAASAGYRIRLRRTHLQPNLGSGANVTLQQPMKITIAADAPRVHPQLGEIAIREDGAWIRMRANLYRASNQSVVANTSRTNGLFAVIYRSLKSRTGDDVERGRDLYVNSSWGDEAFWGDQFQLHEVLNIVDPATAVGAGVQVDLTKVPQPIVDVMLSDDYDTKQAALADPATTRALIQSGAVLGVKGFFEDSDHPDMLTSVGLTCALCHVTVEPIEFQLEPPPAEPVALPIGFPVFGAPNTKIDAGLLLSFTPFVVNETPELIPQYVAWGPGRFDPRFFENNPFNDDVFNPSSIPPNWNFLDLADQGYAITWPGVLQTRPDNHSLASGPECGLDFVLGVNGAWGTSSAAIQDIELGNPLPQLYWDRIHEGEVNEPGNDVRADQLLDLEAFLQSIVSPAPLAFDEDKADMGMGLFFGRANCVSCHSSPEGAGEGKYFTHIVESPPEGLLAIGIKVPGLRGLAFTPPYFHDGSAATLADVIARYNSPDIPETPNDLTQEEQEALMEYLKSL